MSDRLALTQAAFDRMVAAARTHLDAVRAADGVPDDDAVWRAYVELNNATHDYDAALNDAYGEVTPWDLELITDEDEELLREAQLSVPPAVGGDDPHPRVISVRQRRDYRVPSVTALLRAAEIGRPAPVEGETYEPIRTVGAAVIDLLQSGDGSLAMLDLPELEPLDGVVVVAEVDAALASDVLESLPEADSDQPFRLAAGTNVISRMHESALADDGLGD